MESAMEYPYTIIFRVGMMYSLFITFLELLFIKWWLDSFPLAKNTSKMVLFGTIGLAAYGLFVSCIDRKRINYVLSEQAVFVAAIGTSLAIFIIMRNLKKNRENGIALANEQSWLYKKVFSWIHLVGISLGTLIYLGQIDITHKPLVEYLTVISTQLFFWTFSIDFKHFAMDVDKISKPNSTESINM
jgi:hypothetical protein